MVLLGTVCLLLNHNNRCNVVKIDPHSQEGRPQGTDMFACSVTAPALRSWECSLTGKYYVVIWQC